MADITSHEQEEATAHLAHKAYGGLPALEMGELHEVHAPREDAAAALAFALCGSGVRSAGKALLVRRSLRGGAQALVYGDGLALLGFDPARLTIVETDSELDFLRAGLEGARCPGVELVLMEACGRFAGYDLTASRRLALAAERSRACVIMLRHDAEPRPSAARTRWAISSAPSLALEAGAPGGPMIEAELLRWRGGPAGQRWRLEWNADDGIFRDTGGDTGQNAGADSIPPAPVPSTVVPLPFVREGAGDHGTGQPRAA